jgi:hypothetical protein
MNPTTHKQWIAALFILMIVSAFFAGAISVLANGAPVTIYLGYLPNVSNWGPKNITGTAVVAVADGQVALNVKGLPRLENERYELWLESRADRKLYSVTKFNAEADGTVLLRVTMDDLPYQEYRMLFISVEPDPDPSPKPDARTALAGLFPNAAAIQATAQPTQPTTASVSSGTPAPQRPQYLPVTGGKVSADGGALTRQDRFLSTVWVEGVGLLAFGAVMAALLWILKKRKEPAS